MKLQQITFLSLTLLLAVASSAGALRIRGVPRSQAIITIRGGNIDNSNFTLAAQEIRRLVDAGGVTYGTYKDLNTTTHTNASYIREYQINISNETPPFLQVSYSSLNTSVGTVDSNGKVAYVSNGTVGILATSTSPRITKRVDVSPMYLQGQSITTYSGYTSNSLGMETSSSIDSLIAEVTSETAPSVTPLFSIKNDATGTYVRNTSCWANSLDLTAISPWNSTGANTRAGTLISPRHIIFANHYQIANGATVRFVTNDNAVVTRTLVSSARIGSTDIKIGVLNSDVPGSISFAKVLPANWAIYLPSLTSLSIPVLYMDQEKKALVYDLSNYPITSHQIIFAIPRDARRLALYEPLIGGDSGSPAFLVIDNQLVILTTWYSAWQGPEVSSYISEINTAMAALQGGSSPYQLTQVDLSGYPQF